jgi:hypothetical protein
MILDAGYSILDTCCSTLGAGCSTQSSGAWFGTKAGKPAQATAGKLRTGWWGFSTGPLSLVFSFVLFLVSLIPVFCLTRANRNI